MNTHEIVQQLRAERNMLDAAIKALERGAAGPDALRQGQLQSTPPTGSTSVCATAIYGALLSNCETLNPR